MTKRAIKETLFIRTCSLLQVTTFYLEPRSDSVPLFFLLIQVINGLMEREDWQEAIQTPLGILPGGSGNALAASIHHYSQ